MVRARAAGLVMVVACVATPGHANEDKQKETCRITAEIVSSSVTQRASGETIDSVKDVFMKGDSAVAEKYQPTVGPLVDWVFTLEADVIAEDGAADTIAATYEESCLGYKP